MNVTDRFAFFASSKFPNPFFPFKNKKNALTTKKSIMEKIQLLLLYTSYDAKKKDCGNNGNFTESLRVKFPIVL